MPTPTKGPRLGGGPAHERLMLAGLATALFEHGRITTTEAKARRLRPMAERLITKAKRGDLHARRQVLSVLRDKGVVHELFEEIGPRYSGRDGGYTRIVKIGPRKGDNAPMAVIELVEALTVSQQAVREAEAATKRSAKQRPARAAEPVVEETTGETTEELAQDSVVPGGEPDATVDEPVEPVSDAADAADAGADDTDAATADADEDEEPEERS